MYIIYRICFILSILLKTIAVTLPDELSEKQLDSICSQKVDFIPSNIPTAIQFNIHGQIHQDVSIVNVSNVVECVRSCCNSIKCHLAVQYGNQCFNVYCPDFTACSLEEFKNETLTNGTFQVRQPEVGCPNVTKSCNVGVDNCYENQVCVAMGNRRRGGCCRCLESFVQSADGRCTKLEVNLTTTMPVLNNTTTPTSTTTQYIRKLAISISPTFVQLPQDEVTVTAFIVPDPLEGEKYSFNWNVVNYPGGQAGSVEDSNGQTLKLTQLTAGNYTLHITVQSPTSFGEATANLTVKPPQRINQPPVAVATPTSEVVHLPKNNLILDGSLSTDDTEIVSYKWDLEKGPIGYKFEPEITKTLQLKDLVAGNYTFVLTVVDKDGASNSTKALLEVVKEIDYPPKADAGPDVVIFLPQREITLNGNQSTDDHGIVSWEWTRTTDDSATGSDLVKAVDMHNTRTPYLQLSNLDVGMYAFQLKVTDDAGQSSEAVVHVKVQVSSDTKPLVTIGPGSVVTLPTNWAILDGSESKDDIRISKWEWKQLSGPNDAVIINGDQARANATSLTKGQYVFQLTVWDVSNLESSANTTVTVVQKENEKPKANAGGDFSVTLPLSSVVFNGSKSSDDLGIESWLWTREADSVAAGTIVGNSDRTSTLMLTNLVAGKYVFRLNVKDAQGLTDEDTATLFVHSNPHELDMVTLTLKRDPRTFTENELMVLKQQLALLLHQQGTVTINVDNVVVEPKSGYVMVQFLTTIHSEEVRVCPGKEIVHILNRKLHSDPNLLAFPILSLYTTICQNNCSGHGMCDQVTRRCICDAFWVENVISVYYGAEHNCDWSIIYVVIVACLLLGILIGSIWSMMHLCRKGTLPCNGVCSKRRRRQHRYSPLADPEMLKIAGKGINSLLPSDLESESESDVVYETKSNGISNGKKIAHPKSDLVST